MTAYTHLKCVHLLSEITLVSSYICILKLEFCMTLTR